MSATLLRASTRSLRFLCRSVATSASTIPPLKLSESSPQEASEQPSSPSAPRRSTLPADKMRALILLYHQSENFITPDNLSYAIDAAFIQHPAYRDNIETTYSELESVVKSQKRKPKVGTNANLNVERNKHAEALVRSMQTLWSQQRPQREVEVMNALFGTHAGKPDLETLEDEYDRIEARLKEKDDD